MSHIESGRYSPQIRYERYEADHRPWGRWEVLDTGPHFTVKRITVEPGAQLSLQLHYHRDEHWVVVMGTAQVMRGDEVFELRANESTFIPRGTQHRIFNPGDAVLEFIEVQYGEILDENDIVRLEDSYGRI